MSDNHLYYGSESADKKIHIVIPTSYSKDAVLSDIKNRKLIPSIWCLDKMNFNNELFVDVEIIWENKDGLSTVYNRVLEDSVKDELKKDDFVIFMHDDIWLNDVLVFDKIFDISDKLDVIGVCGGKTWTYKNTENGKPIIWTVASAQAGASGFMLHGASISWNPNLHDMDYEKRSFFSSNYGSSPSRTLTIDGSFMCFGRKAIETLRFDDQFKFHFYDMDVSFSAYVKGLKVGTAPILLSHNSLGESVAQPSYMEMQRKFLDKWFVKKNS